jgi:hypothetical protein
MIKNKRYTVEYSSNNSGGDWWLHDDDWLALEAAGWDVHWYRDMDPGMRLFHDKDSDRFLGALAHGASIEVEAPDEYIAREIGIDSWVNVVATDPDAQGCPCCGQPHYFYADEVTDDKVS